MPHSEPEEPLVKRQKISSVSQTKRSSSGQSRIFAPYRVCVLTSHFIVIYMLNFLLDSWSCIAYKCALYLDPPR